MEDFRLSIPLTKINLNRYAAAVAARERALRERGQAQLSASPFG